MENSKRVLRWLKENLDEDNYVSVMAQYFPTYLVKEKYPEINRKLTKEEWKEIEDFVEKMNFKMAIYKNFGEHEEEYVPNWW